LAILSCCFLSRFTPQGGRAVLAMLRRARVRMARGIAFNQKKPVKSIPAASGRHQKSCDPG
jgi:hypothetical protein